MSKRIFRASLSFSKKELRSTIRIGDAGIGMSFVGSDDPVRKEHYNKITESLGLFGGSSDSNKFYPGNNAKSIIPKDEDFVKVPFRLLSATIVAGYSWRATDFTNAQVLKASTKKLDGKPVFTEHDNDVLNHVGIVKFPRWSEAYTSSDGNKIPAGIDGDIWIDTVTSPKIARSVLSGGIYSESVTIEFDWEKSHEIEDDEVFLRKVGTMGEDGKMIARKVTNVIDYHESSLVWLGADPFAKQIKDGELMHPEWGSVVEFEKEVEDVRNTYQKKKKYFAGSCLSKSEAISLAKEYDFGLTKQTTTAMNKELIAFLLTFCKVDSEDKLTVDHFKNLKVLAEGQQAVPLAEFSDLQAAKTKLAELEPQLNEAKASVTALTSDKATLTAEVEELKPKAELGTKFLNLKRDEVKRLYALSVSNKTDSALIAIFDKATDVELEAFLNQYTKGAKEMFKAKCKKCGSDEVSFRSSVSEGDGGNQNSKVEDETLSFDAMYKKYNTSNVNKILNS